MSDGPVGHGDRWTGTGGVGVQQALSKLGVLRVSSRKAFAEAGVAPLVGGQSARIVTLSRGAGAEAR
jgi:hypothetical protein